MQLPLLLNSKPDQRRCDSAASELELTQSFTSASVSRSETTSGPSNLCEKVQDVIRSLIQTSDESLTCDAATPLSRVRTRSGQK